MPKKTGGEYWSLAGGGESGRGRVFPGNLD